MGVIGCSIGSSARIEGSKFSDRNLENLIEINRGAYYLALRQTQGAIHTDSPNWQPWLNAIT
jgi:hypothetical protein